jgi:hypothetical protein
MALRDWLTLAAILGGLVVIFAITRHGQPERVRPGSPEYTAYIEHHVGECLRNPQPVDRTYSDREPSSDTERAAARRASVLQADRLNPDNRPLRRP